ncbi:LpxH: predicted UDP-2,3-diacylglucosamine diphosphatase [Desulfosarcina variabilis str. Montpellier]|uniref:metallophosphoesterase n=1 Tax=Desulfosarcina variabilis TaxID=2300 RepID=UPI003AFA67C4
MNNKKIVVVADPHLESTQNDVQCMVAFLKTLIPSEHILVFLGDLFHVWVESPQYHTEQVQYLMNELSAFRRQGGRIHLIVGNRDLFFNNISSFSEASHLPFDSINLDFLRLYFASGMIMAHHGDTVNRKDKRYLRWRKVVRSRLVKYVFNKLPAQKVKTILWDLERKMKQTNIKFKQFFPEDEWTSFVKQVHYAHSPTILLVGHFHPPRPIVTKYASTTGIVVPAWHKAQSYLILDSQLKYQFRSFSPFLQDE